MLRSRRRSRAYRTVAVTILACLALALLAGSATAAKVFVKESMATFESQLHSGHVHAVVVHVPPHTIHASLNGGEKKVTVTYQPSQEAAMIAAIKARGVPVQVVRSKGGGLKSHPLRFIAGIVVIVVIIIVVVVLLVNRRRKRQAEMGLA